MYWRVRRSDHSLQNGSSLTHYGILGMKWGVRRTPEQLGHVKKGTKIYRVTPDPNEKEEGSTYVTYLRPDRDMYRGAFNKQGGFAKYYNIDPKSPMYESVYTNKEDLKVATYDVQKEITNRIMRQDKEKLLKDLSKSVAQDGINDFKAMVDRYKDLRQKHPDMPIADESQLRSIYERN